MIDELSFATNWIRSFQDIYRQVKWLTSYASVNEIASKKIVTLYMLEYFECSDNVLDKGLDIFLE